MFPGLNQYLAEDKVSADEAWTRDPSITSQELYVWATVLLFTLP